MQVLERKDQKPVRSSSMKFKWNLFWPHQPDMDRLLAELKDNFESRWWGQGPKVKLFEEKFKSKFSCDNAVMTYSGTGALQLAFRLAGIAAGDYVVSSAVTCTAVHHVLKLIGANILLCDVEPNTLNPDPKHAEELCNRHNVRAIIPVHIAGRPCNIEEFKNLSVVYDVPIIYDACQALGAKFNGRDVLHPDNCGLAAAVSFQAVKVITTGDGGMLALAGDGHAYRAQVLRWFAIDRERREKEFGFQPWKNRQITTDQEEVGYKFQPTDIDASIGLVQLEEVNEVLALRKRLAHLYRLLLGGECGFTAFDCCDETYQSSHWLFGGLVERRDDFCNAMNSRGVETGMVQLRNDIYTFMGGERRDLPVLNGIEEQYG